VAVQRADEARPTDLLPDLRTGLPLILRPGDRFLTVDMRLLSYEPPGQVRYAWRIDGIDTEWNIQREPNLRFTMLPYGEHRLRLRAIDGEGRWTPGERIVPLVVLRPLFLRWWFLAACALLLAGAVFALVRYRERQLRRVLQVRDRIAMDLHDEVGSDLSGIVLFSSAVASQAGTLPPKAAAMLQRIADNSTRAMEGMNDIVWSVNTTHDHLSDVVDRMQAYAQPLCDAAGIELLLEVPPALAARRLGMEERKSLYLIFKEAVNNAVKHARCSRIEVRMRAVDKRIELSVADNGKGLRATVTTDTSLGGNGLVNMQRRASGIGGELTHRSRAGGGTEVILLIATGRA